MPETTSAKTNLISSEQLRKEAKEARKKSMQESWRRMARNKVAVVGLAVIIVIVLIAVFAPFLTQYDPDVVDPINSNQTPSGAHPFGTDALGRDVMARVFFGARYSLLIAFTSQGVGIVIGILFGALAGYFAGLLSDFIMRFCDIFQAIPGTLMAIVISQTLGPGFVSTVIAMAVTTIPGTTRAVRALIMQIRDQEYVEAGRAITCSDGRLISKYILPNIIPQVIISFTGGLSGKFIQSAGLSYLGLGVQPPTAEWGALLTEGKSFLRYYPHLVIFPGLAIAIAALAFNLFGDGLRDALDPRLRD